MKDEDRRVGAEVVPGGRLAVGATLARAPEPGGPAPARVALGVDAARAERLIRGRSAGPSAA